MPAIREKIASTRKATDPGLVPKMSTRMTRSSNVEQMYHFDNVTFEVEGTLFRVPRNYFERESEVFRDMFQLPVAKGTEPDGSSDDRPLHLYGVQLEDFRQLLRAMFPTHLLAVDTFSISQMISILKLSIMWRMDAVTASAIEKMSNLSYDKGSQEEWTSLLDLSIQHNLPAARTLAIKNITPTLYGQGTRNIVMARKYGVERWMLSGLKELVKRRDFISDEEEQELGWRTTFKLCRLREKQRKSGYGNFTNDIRQEFADELAGMTIQVLEPTVEYVEY